MKIRVLFWAAVIAAAAMLVTATIAPARQARSTEVTAARIHLYQGNGSTKSGGGIQVSCREIYPVLQSSWGITYTNSNGDALCWVPVNSIMDFWGDTNSGSCHYHWGGYNGSWSVRVNVGWSDFEVYLLLNQVTC